MDGENAYPEVSDELSSLDDVGPGGLVIEAGLAECVNYASWQNSVPFLSSLEVHNASSQSHSNLTLKLETSPAVTRKKSWLIDRVAPGGSVAILDREVTFDPEYLNGLNEAERCVARFQLLDGDHVIAEAAQDIRVLARDEWGGMGSMGELLSAFVMPNDPAIAPILKSAATVLHQHGHSPALDGYQSGDPSRSYLLVAAIWSAVAGRSLTYANPPRSFETVGQKARRPSTVMTDGLATCLDSTLLFAAAIEAVGLNPVVVMTQGHCFVGVWLVDKTSNRLIEPDCSELRKAIAAKELVTFESTLVTHKPPARFTDAVKASVAATRESEESNFIAIIDIARARMAQIRPLASHEANVANESDSASQDGPLPLPKAPDMGGLPAEVGDEKPTTSEGRIDRWQRKLLDLSLRNRLLNFKHGKQTVPIVCPDVSLLEDRLADGGRLRMISLSDQNPIGERDSELHRRMTNKDLDAEFAKQAMDRDELACQLPEQELSNRLTTLYRKVRNDLSEGGSNTLFLAVGFLKWKQKPDDEKSYRAPLLLVPVKLTRKSALSAYRLEHHEDDVRFNATLIQLLKKDFDRDLSRLESDLPTDHSGVDVPKILDLVRREVRDVPGFEVVDETALSTFSFAKYLMWKDLVDRVDQLEQNRVVRHLICDPDKPFPTEGGVIPCAEEVDVRYEPKDIVHPLPADSSQLAAVMAASEGKDFVLVGPPGTGKSQTIANIISQCLATNKTVLFVAEKTAALDVVYRRLREHGLGDCCLELHSNKAERRRFLDQLEAAWTNNSKAQKSGWIQVSERLKVRRDELNTYVSAIHKEYPNGWSAFDAFGISVRGRTLHAPTLDWHPSVRHDDDAYRDLKQMVEDLARTYDSIDLTATLPMVAALDWSVAWESQLLSTCQQLLSAASAAQSALTNFAASVGLAAKSDCSLTEASHLRELAQALLNGAGDDSRILFHKQFAEFPSAVTNLEAAIRAHRKARQDASAVYDESVAEIPVDDLDRQWRQAVASIWPISWLSKRKVTKLLQSYASSGASDPSVDLAAIREMSQQLCQIKQSPLAGQTTHWKAQDTDTGQLQSYLQRARELRRAIISVSKPLGSTKAVSTALLPMITGRAQDSPVFAQATEFLQSWEHFELALDQFTESSRRMPVDDETKGVIAESIRAATHVQKNRTQLRRWTAWCQIKHRAAAAGLQAFINELEEGGIKSSDLADRFEVAYARWWISIVIDGSDVLRSFQRFKHEDAVEDFCALDEQARQIASSRVREAITHQLPTSDSVPRRSELGLLRHQIGLKRPSKSIREVISHMPESFGKLAPCLLMSPLSIAQYLPASQAIFDVVIFDEASQIPTWDAIGAIARGRQAIIVGDPKQLPPTNFFGRADSDDEDDEIEDHDKDLESILDEAKASGLPTLQLNWHYRSRHESLITFSNWHYYGNQLVTFPAAESTDRGVSLHHVPEAVYDRGKSRTNRGEAEAIVADAVRSMKKCLEQPEEERRTFGVITFNSQQQSLIQDLFDEAQRDHPELDWYFADDRIEPTVVKNLENVQGDERDVMYFSVTFGRDVSGRDIPLTFGALNRDGGERRLNVAVTRARQELLVYSSFRADELNADRSKARGVRDLKNFLEYAEKGPIALAAETKGSVGGFDSPFEEAVADSLSGKGWQIVPQVGVSGFRVDLGITHPDRPGAYLAGVECDGATYHRSAIARDRDKTRQQVLENLGWNILRVWSPDWWYDSDGAIEKVDQALRELLDKSRGQDEVPEPESIQRSEETQGFELAPGPGETPSQSNETSVDPESDPNPPMDEEPSVSGSVFRRANLEAFQPNADAFFDDQYSATLQKMVQEVLRVEAPIRDDVLAKQVARVHGFARTGAKIRQRIIASIETAMSSEESTGTFLWGDREQADVIEYRHSRSEEDRRSVDEIAIAELRGLVQSMPEMLTEADPALSLARAMGINRLAQSSRSRIEESIQWVRERRATGPVDNMAADSEQASNDGLGPNSESL